MNVLIIDDHPIFRTGLRSLLEEETVLGLTHFAEAGSIAEAMAALGECVPDFAIIDIALGKGDGLEWIKDVRAMGHTFPALFMSMYDERLYAERVLKAGGNGYLMKRELANNMVEAIQAILNGGTFLSESMTHAMRFRGESDLTAIERLSDRELEVFRMIGEGRTTKEIAEGLRLSVKTIETYRGHLKVKLELRNSAELASAASRWLESTLSA